MVRLTQLIYPTAPYNSMYQMKQNRPSKFLRLSGMTRAAGMAPPDINDIRRHPSSSFRFRSGPFGYWHPIIRCIRCNRTALFYAYAYRETPKPSGMGPPDITDISRQSISGFRFRSGPFPDWHPTIRCIQRNRTAQVKAHADRETPEFHWRGMSRPT